MNAWREWRDAEPAQFAVIGDPIKHSRSPRMQEAALRAMGLDHRYVALRVPSGEVAEAFDLLSGLGYLGVNVTVPHKYEAFLAMRSVELFARRVEAVNTVRLPDLAGVNTDGPGFMDSLAPLALPRGCRVLVLGAGGSAVSIAAALVEGGFEVRIYNRTRSRAEALVARLGIPAEILDTADPSGCELIVNATSAGLHDAELPVDWASAKPDAVAYDLVYGSEPTRFLRTASDRGLRTIDGLPLLVAQGARSLEWWLGREAPRQVMLESLR
jgi:shikimate dehydrogenase